MDQDHSLSDCQSRPVNEEIETGFKRNRGVVWDTKTACWCTPPQELAILVYQKLWNNILPAGLIHWLEVIQEEDEVVDRVD